MTHGQNKILLYKLFTYLCYAYNVQLSLGFWSTITYEGREGLWPGPLYFFWKPWYLLRLYNTATPLNTNITVTPLYTNITATLLDINLPGDNKVWNQPEPSIKCRFERKRWIDSQNLFLYKKTNLICYCILVCFVDIMEF